MACGPYEGVLGALVRAYKYNREVMLVDELAGFLLAQLRRHEVRADFVVAVPMHPLREMGRGLDHAGRLAEKVASEMGITHLEGVLIRSRMGPRQVGLSYSARREAVRGAFKVVSGARLKRRSFLLVDDVMTTGATVSECARVLHVAGAGEVRVAVIARQTRSLIL